jgi:hypothetical protein
MLGSLREVNLDDKPDFKALSYTWGQAVVPYGEGLGSTMPSIAPLSFRVSDVYPTALFKSVEEDHRKSRGPVTKLDKDEVYSIKIGPNLSEFLLCYLEQHFRLFAREPVWDLWIDAICIDQKNALEKAIQIGLMGEIYASAGKVLIWLGKESKDMDTFLWMNTVVLSALKFMSFHFPTQQAFIEWASQWYPEDPNFWQRHASISPRGGSWIECWMAYFRFYCSRRWFSRAWVVQEATLAQNVEITFGKEFCGLPWDDMVVMVQFVRNTNWANRLQHILLEGGLQGMGDAHILLGQGIYDIDSSRTSFQNICGQDTRASNVEQALALWFDTLRLTRRRKSFLPEDRIYSTLGVLERALPSGEVFPLPIIPGENIEQVFLRVSAFILTHFHDIILLSYMDDRMSRTCLVDLPSWVPDYSNSKWPLPISSIENYFAAPIALEPSDKLRIEGKELVLRGAPFAIILDQSPAFGSDAHLLSQFNIVSQLGPIYITGQSRLEVFWRTLILDTSGPDGDYIHPAKDALGWDFRCVVRRAIWEYLASKSGSELERAKEYCSSIFDRLGPDEFLPSLAEIERYTDPTVPAAGPDYKQALLKDPREYEGSIVLKATYRNLFRTNNGLLGLCPRTSQPDDSIWLIKGARVPYVLRPHLGRESYTFIGECYIHGAMHGEFMTDKRRKAFREIRLV